MKSPSQCLLPQKPDVSALTSIPGTVPALEPFDHYYDTGKKLVKESLMEPPDRKMLDPIWKKRPRQTLTARCKVLLTQTSQALTEKLRRLSDRIRGSSPS